MPSTRFSPQLYGSLPDSTTFVYNRISDGMFDANTFSAFLVSERSIPL